MNPLAPLLYVTGLFALVLGGLHFFFPILFDFDGAIPRRGPPLKPFRLGFIRLERRLEHELVPRHVAGVEASGWWALLPGTASYFG